LAHCVRGSFFDFFQINELKKAHMKGGRSVFTWQKGANDKYVNAFGVALAIYGIAQLIPGHYKLATGKGKME
jgi:hypothetical protein